VYPTGEHWMMFEWECEHLHELLSDAYPEVGVSRSCTCSHRIALFNTMQMYTCAKLQTVFRVRFFTLCIDEVKILPSYLACEALFYFSRHTNIHNNG